MKALKSIKYLTFSVSVLGILVVYSPVNAQEYDDMYFSKSDRKTVKIDKTAVLSSQNKSVNSADYKKISESTETYSAKNVNPEYIARYKNTDNNQVNEQTGQKNDAYSSKDYFVEGYDNNEYVGDPNNGEIDYDVLNRRDQMSYSNRNRFGRSFSNSSWGFNPYMGMGFGNPYFGGYGYDPFMMGYGSGMSLGFGSGFGFAPSMAFGMSWGAGYNPWGGWGGYPGFYDPYGMRGFYDPWGSTFGFSPYSRFGYSSFYRGRYGFGGYFPTVIVRSYSNSGESLNGRNVYYGPRTARSNSTQRYTRTNSENLRTSSSDAKIRVPSRNTSTSNGRVSRDYSKVQNEYYSRSRRSSSSSSQRISASDNSRKSIGRSSSSSRASRYSSAINSNKPARTNNQSSGYSRSSGNRSSSFSGYSSGSSRRSSSNSFSAPSRSSSSFSSGSRSSSGRSSSYSSGGSRSSSSSGSRSSGSSSRGRRQ